MISCQKPEISPEQIFNGESNLPVITAISQEIWNQPYCVPRKSGKKKHPDLNFDEEVDILQIPNSLKKLVRQFVIKFSGYYIFDLNENWNKEYTYIVKKLYSFAPVVRLAIFSVTYKVYSKRTNLNWRASWEDDEVLSVHP